MAQRVPGRLRPRIFLMFRHYKGGRSSAKRTGRLHLRRNPWYSLSEAESTTGHMVLSGEPRKKSPLTPPGIDPGTVRLVAYCLNHYATPGPILFKKAINLGWKHEFKMTFYFLHFFPHTLFLFGQFV